MTHPNALAISPARHDVDDRPAVRRKPDELAELTPKHRRMIEVMTWGAETDDVRAILRDGVPIEPGVPLRLSEAAQLCGVRQKNARELMASGLFQGELTREVHRLRMSAKPGAMAKLIELRDRVGNGTAADAKVSLAAAQALLGEDAGSRPSAVNVNVGVAVQAGYIIDLRPYGDDGPLPGTYDPAPPDMKFTGD